MKNFLIARNFWLAVTLWGGFWGIAPFFAPEYVFYIVNALGFAVAAGVTIAYLGGVKQSILRNDLDGAHYLVMGVVVAWFATGMRQAWYWAWRALDKPDWMIDHLFLAFLSWMVFTAGVLHLMAKDAISGAIPRENWLYLGVVIAVAIGLSLIGTLWFNQPIPFDPAL